MESDKKPALPEKNKKPSPHGGSYMWYLLGLGVLLLLMVTIFTNGSPEEIAWSDLVRLVKQSKQSDSGDVAYRHWIEIEDTSAKTPTRVKLANLSDVVVYPSKVKGTVEWIEIDRETGDPIRTERSTNERAFVSYRDHNDDQILTLLDQTDIKHRNAQPQDPLLSNLMWFAVFIGMIVLFLLLLRRMGGAGSPMAFGRSRGKLYAQEDIDVTFDDVAGIEEAVDELREVVDFLRNPERYQLSLIHI